jgi:glycosyltransferase involved in cell wall biosynthesis
MLKLSIITINKNNVAGLRKTIQSVINQSYPNIEYIIIDGASTDKSVEVIKEFENHISWWVSEPDKGIYNAMNKGIEKATGDYCQFLNSGDCLFDSESTEKMLMKDSECSFIYGNLIKISNKGKKIHNKQLDTKSLFTFYSGTLNHSSTYIKRELFEKYGYYDEKLKIVSDWKFFLVTIGLNNESVEYRNVDLVVFDMNGISNSSTDIMKLERRLVLQELLPANIMLDYENYKDDLIKIKRLNRYPFFKNLLWFIERILFKLEKWNISN